MSIDCTFYGAMKLFAYLRMEAMTHIGVDYSVVCSTIMGIAGALGVEWTTRWSSLFFMYINLILSRIKLIINMDVKKQQTE